jgi:hypothetical protein
MCCAALAVDRTIECLSTRPEREGPSHGTRAHFRLRQIYDIITTATPKDHHHQQQPLAPRGQGHDPPQPADLSDDPSCNKARDGGGGDGSGRLPPRSMSDMSSAVNAHLLDQLTAMTEAMRSCRWREETPCCHHA